MKVYHVEVTDPDGRLTMSYVYRSMEEAEQDIVAELRRLFIFDDDWCYIWTTCESFKAVGYLGPYDIWINEIDLGETDE